MKSYLAVLLAVAAAALVDAAPAVDPPSVRVTVRVTSDDGQPLEGVRVGVGGGISTPDRRYPRHVTGETDGAGLFVTTVGSLYGQLSVMASAPRFYLSELHYGSVTSSPSQQADALAAGHWPDTTVAVILRPVRQPVPMIVRVVDKVVPEVGKAVGFDLEVGDWVAPHGRGQRPDLTFAATGSFASQDNYDATVTLTVPGEENGVQPFDIGVTGASEFKMPYSAPTSGYVSTWTWHTARQTGAEKYAQSRFVDESGPKRAFLFRVRSELDSERRLIRSNYGRISGPVTITVGPGGRAGVRFVYYFNPDCTPNLEYDPAHNLAMGQPKFGP